MLLKVKFAVSKRYSHSFSLCFSVVQAYRNMFNPGVEIIDGNGTIEETVNKIYEKVQHLL